MEMLSFIPKIYFLQINTQQITSRELHHCHDFTAKLSAFVIKLHLWREKVNAGSFDMFENLSAILPLLESIPFMKDLVAVRLSQLIREFQEYFPDLNHTNFKQSRSPFRLTVGDADSDLQEELLSFPLNLVHMTLLKMCSQQVLVFTNNILPKAFKCGSKSFANIS